MSEIIKRIRAKKDIRLYFSLLDGTSLNLTLGELKTKLIKLGYIEHLEGDKHYWLKKMGDKQKLIEEIRETKIV